MGRFAVSTAAIIASFTSMPRILSFNGTISRSSSLIKQFVEVNQGNVANCFQLPNLPINWGWSCMSQLSSNATLKYSQAWKSECNCDSIIMLILDILRSTEWRDSWTSDNTLFSLLFSEDKIPTMSEAFFNELPFIVWLFGLCNDMMQALQSLSAS